MGVSADLLLSSRIFNEVLACGLFLNHMQKQHHKIDMFLLLT